MSGHDQQKIIIITGPTATGKSALAVELAEHFEGEIINCDSMQVYRGMDIGTAKPSLNERHGIPHYMIDVVNPSDEFNASMYRRMTIPVIGDVAQRGKPCFIVGGTGLYIKTLLGGLIDCPPVPSNIRERLREECETHGVPFLHERLKTLDPEYADKISPNDRVRVLRALEITTVANRPLSSLISVHSFGENLFDPLKICLFLEREDLYKRINERSVAMLGSGLIEETERLLKAGYSVDLKPMKSIGYRHAAEYIDGIRSYEETLDLLQRDTRRYAKRQITWFKADPGMCWFRPEEKEKIRKKIENFI